MGRMKHLWRFNQNEPTHLAYNNATPTLSIGLSNKKSSKFLLFRQQKCYDWQNIYKYGFRSNNHVQSYGMVAFIHIFKKNPHTYHSQFAFEKMRRCTFTRKYKSESIFLLGHNVLSLSEDRRLHLMKIGKESREILLKNLPEARVCLHGFDSHLAQLVTWYRHRGFSV